jgi:hypothetical protein
MSPHLDLNSEGGRKKVVEMSSRSDVPPTWVWMWVGEGGRDEQ